MERFLMSSKLNNYPPLLGYLFDLGRKTCDAWIAQNEKALGKHSTLDVQQLLSSEVSGTSIVFTERKKTGAGVKFRTVRSRHLAGLRDFPGFAEWTKPKVDQILSPFAIVGAYAP